MAKSSKQKAAELKVRRAARKVKAGERRRDDLYAFRICTMPEAGSAPVNAALLEPGTSYWPSDFMTRGYYLDQPFECRDCKTAEVWTATQQKWWFEIAKGGVATRAHRCRPCRRKERERVADARRASDEGRARKARLKAAGKWRTGL